MATTAHRTLSAHRVYQFRGQELSASRIRQIREVVREHPKATRQELARRICERFGWRRPNGEARLAACRVLLVRMEATGDLRLPLKGAGRIGEKSKAEASGRGSAAAQGSSIVGCVYGCEGSSNQGFRSGALAVFDVAVSLFGRWRNGRRTDSLCG